MKTDQPTPGALRAAATLHEWALGHIPTPKRQNTWAELIDRETSAERDELRRANAELVAALRILHRWTNDHVMDPAAIIPIEQAAAAIARHEAAAGEGKR